MPLPIANETSAITNCPVWGRTRAIIERREYEMGRVRAVLVVNDRFIALR
jgi:hypothetical protein